LPTSQPAAAVGGMSTVQAAQLTTILDAALNRFAGPLAEPSKRIVHAGGQRLRPALTLACAALGSPPGDVMVLAAAVELLHCATLVHDDVIDDAAARRGVATVNAVEGSSTAILTGDVLIAAACGLATSISGEAGAVVAATLAQLCAGQALEETFRFNQRTTTEDAVRSVRGKTGSLLQAACLLGAQAAQLQADLGEALGEYGMAFGVCLQLIDDVLDVVSSRALLGKAVGVDFAAGTMTVPVVTCLAVHPDFGELLHPGLEEPGRARALALLRTEDVVGPTVALAREHAERAATALRAAAPGHPSITALADLPGYYVEAQLRTKVHPACADLVPPSSLLSATRQ